MKFWLEKDFSPSVSLVATPKSVSFITPNKINNGDNNNNIIVYYFITIFGG